MGKIKAKSIFRLVPQVGNLGRFQKFTLGKFLIIRSLTRIRCFFCYVWSLLTFLIHMQLVCLDFKHSKSGIVFSTVQDRIAGFKL